MNTSAKKVKDRLCSHSLVCLFWAFVTTWPCNTAIYLFWYKRLILNDKNTTVIFWGDCAWIKTTFLPIDQMTLRSFCLMTNSGLLKCGSNLARQPDNLNHWLVNTPKLVCTQLWKVQRVNSASGCLSLNIYIFTMQSLSKTFAFIFSSA